MSAGENEIPDERGEDRGPSRGRSLLRLGKDAAWIAVLAGTVVAALHGIESKGRRPDGGLGVGEAAPEVALEEIRTGELVRLSNLRGRPVILSFWATWCPPCVRELPRLDRLDRGAGERFAVLTVTEEPPQIVLPFLAKRSLRVPVLYDPGGRTARAFGVHHLPTTVILDASGRIVHDFGGEVDPEFLAGHVERLVSTRP